jgi:hypothetical protein
MTPVVLITVQPRIPGTGATATLRLAGGGGVKPYHYAGEHWRAGIASLPRFKAELKFEEGGWTGGVVPTTGTIAWAPAGKAALSELAAYHWPRAAITIQEGFEEDGAFTTRLTGKVADAPIQDQQLVITVADLGADLDRPLVTSRFLGTGGVEGGAEAKGRSKRRTWGRAFNIEGRVLDKANNVFEFGDLIYPWQSFEVVRDKGRDAAPALAGVAWQGSVAATLEALRTSSPAVGTAVAAPSICCVKWWTQPAGPLTADVNGEIGAGYVETVPSIAERILVAAAGPAVTNTAAANAWRSDVAGIHVDDGESVAAVLDRLLMGVSLVWLLDPAGTVTFREITFAAPIAAIASDSVKRLRTLPPVKTRRVGYKKANRTHNDGELAAILLEAGASFIQADPPGALDSAPGAHWLDSDDGYATYERVAGSGYLQLAGGALLLNGAPIELAWIRIEVGPAEKASWSRVVDDNGFLPQDGADVTLTAQVTVAPPPDVTIHRDSGGTVITGQLPRTIARPGITRNGVSIATAANVSYVIQNILGGIGTPTIDNIPGSLTKGQSTVPSGGFSGAGSFEILVTVDGVPLQPLKVLVGVQNAEATSGGGSGSKSASTAIGDTITSASMVQVGATMTVTKAAGETMRGTFGASYLYAHSSSGSRYAALKWQYAPIGTGTWTDFSSAANGTDASFDVATFDQSPGSVTCSQNVAPADGTYDVRLAAAMSASGGNISFDGSMAAINVGV